MEHFLHKAEHCLNTVEHLQNNYEYNLFCLEYLCLNREKQPNH